MLNKRRRPTAKALEYVFGGLLDRWYQGRMKRDLTRHALAIEQIEMMVRQSSETVQQIDPKRRIDPPKSDATYQELEQTYEVGIWIYRAINAIAENGASVKMVIQDSEGNLDPALPLPDRPNSVYNWTEIRQLLHVWCELTGNAFLWRDRENDEYWGLRPSRIRVVPGEDGRSVAGYAYRVTGFEDSRTTAPSRLTQTRYFTTAQRQPMYVSLKEFNNQVAKWTDWLSNGVHQQEKFTTGTSFGDEWIPIPAEDMIHLRYVDPSSDYYGMTPLKPLLISFISEMNARKWNEKFFENGAVPSGILVFPRLMPKGEFKRLTEQFKERHTGVLQAWLPFITQAGAEFKPFENAHTDLDFLNLIKMSRDETLAAFGVPPIMVGIYEGSEGSTRSIGIREQRTSFWHDTVIPKNKLMGAAFTHTLADLLPDGSRFWFDFDDIDALQPNWEVVTQAAERGIKAGMSPQEVRTKILRLPAVPEDGVIYLPTGLVPIDLNNPMPVEEWYQYMNPQQMPYQIRYGRLPIAANPPALGLPVNGQQGHRTNGNIRREPATKANAEDEEGREAEWKVVDKQFDVVEADLLTWLTPIFEAQERRYLTLVRTSFQKSGISKAPTDIEGDIIQSRAGEVAIFEEAASIEFNTQIGLAGEFGLKQAEIKAGFDVLNPNVLFYVEEKAIAFSQKVSDTTIDQLRRQIREWLREGENINDLTNRVRRVFDGTVRGTKHRARLIARTESAGIVNGGQRLAFEQYPDVVPRIEWRSSRDSRVRSTHVAADGQTTSRTGTFVVGGSIMRFPGDPRAPVREIANCRCTVLPIVDVTALDLLG